MRLTIKLLAAGIWVGVAVAPVGAGTRDRTFAPAHTNVQDAIESAHAVLWNKLIGADGLIHDFVGELPAAEDCRLGKPNAIG